MNTFGCIVKIAKMHLQFKVDRYASVQFTDLEMTCVVCQITNSIPHPRQGYFRQHSYSLMEDKTFCLVQWEFKSTKE